MANQITGKILYIYPEQQISSKDMTKTFVKREIVIDCTRFDPYTGERGFENTPSLEFFGDKCAELDKFQAGQVVTVTFDVQGTRVRNADGVEKIFTRIQPYRIELRQPQRPATVAQNVPKNTYRPSVPNVNQASDARPSSRQEQTHPTFPPQVDAAGNPVSDLPF